jgi:hypothetical protein
MQSASYFPTHSTIFSAASCAKGAVNGAPDLSGFLPHDSVTRQSICTSIWSRLPARQNLTVFGRVHPENPHNLRPIA